MCNCIGGYNFDNQFQTANVLNEGIHFVIKVNVANAVLNNVLSKVIDNAKHLSIL